MHKSLLFCLALLVGSESFAKTPVIKLRFDLIRQLKRSVSGLTEGLLIQNGAIYESTGLIPKHGPSSFNRIDLETGQVTELARTPQNQFGEGLAVWNGFFYQLTYTSRVMHQYITNGTAAGTRRVTSFAWPLKEGWGLTTDGSQLLATDGSAYLYRIDPTNGSIRSKVKVVDGAGKSIRGLNELEYVEGAVYANVFPGNRLIRFNAATGIQDAEFDLSELRKLLACPKKTARIECTSDSVPNGIAYHPGSSSFYLTGKSWPYLYEGRFNPY